MWAEVMYNFICLILRFKSYLVFYYINKLAYFLSKAHFKFPNRVFFFFGNRLHLCSSIPPIKSHLLTVIQLFWYNLLKTTHRSLKQLMATAFWDRKNILLIKFCNQVTIINIDMCCKMLTNLKVYRYLLFCTALSDF